MRVTAAPLLLGAFLLAACSGTDLAADDPDGYNACVLLAEVDTAQGDPLMRMGAMFEVAEYADDATTQAIRNAASPVFDAESKRIIDRAGGEAPDTELVDSEALADACEANGVEIP